MMVSHFGPIGSPGEARFGFPRMLRFMNSAVSESILPDSDRPDIAFPKTEPGRHTEVRISELVSWPALPPARTLSTTLLPSIAPPPEAKIDG